MCVSVFSSLFSPNIYLEARFCPFMPKTQVVRDPINEESFFILEDNGVLTNIQNSPSGVTISQRRPGRERGSFHSYEDYGLSFYPPLFRLLGATGSRFPTIPKPSREGNDDYAKNAKTLAEYVEKQPYPFEYHEGGYSNVHRIRAIFHPSLHARGFEFADNAEQPIFVSPALARELLRVLPQINPRVKSYKIMEAYFQSSYKNRSFQKIEFERVPVPKTLKPAAAVRPKPRPGRLNELVRRLIRLRSRRM